MQQLRREHESESESKSERSERARARVRGEREREKRESERDSEHAREAGTCGTCCGKVPSECYLTTMGGDLASAAALGPRGQRKKWSTFAGA